MPANHRTMFLVFVGLVSSGVAVLSMSQRSGANLESEEYTISIPSPNTTLRQENGFMCSPVLLPAEQQFIVGIEPKPIPGLHYHIFLYLCDEIGPDGTDEGLSSTPLTCGPNGLVERSDDPSKRCNRAFYFQYQGGDVDEGSFHSPAGTGVPVGGETGFKTMIAMFHFFRPEELMALTNGSTAGSEVRVTMSRSPDLQSVSSLILSALGFVGARDVGSVSSSWTMDRDVVLHLLLLHSHWHDLATDIQVRVVRPDGSSDVVVRIDPHAFYGVKDVSDSPFAVMRRGDRLVHECTYNNTLDHNLRIERQDMCDLFFYYTMDGETGVMDSRVISIDPVYKDCITDLRGDHAWTSINYEGESSFKGASGEDCSSDSVYDPANAKNVSFVDRY